ncbi:NAD(P)-binding protein [Trametopsis cervina]|nr:NAD(P)-binding protein [Trametopsis cervina]
MSDTLTWLVTGTSRGIGLEFVKQLLDSPTNVVIAACRNPDKAIALTELKNSTQGSLYVVQLDTSSVPSIEAVVPTIRDIVGDRGLDYLINNAGVNVGADTAFNFEVTDLIDTFTTNVLGPAHLAQVLLPLIEQSQKKFILNFSSGLASMGLNHAPVNATYSISKTAVGMLTHKQAKAKPELTVIAVDPGWVKTDMGGPRAVMEPWESVEAILKLVARSTAEVSGKFFLYDGKELPW